MLQNNWISKEQHDEILQANFNALSSPSTYALEKTRVINERKKFHHKLFKTPKETAVALVTTGENKAKYRKRRLFLMGILAGVFVAFGCFVGLYCSALFQWPTPTITTTTTTTLYPFLLFPLNNNNNNNNSTTSTSTSTTTTTNITQNDTSTVIVVTEIVESRGGEILNILVAKKLIYGFTFPIGLILISLFGGELFSGNTMTFTIGLLCRTITAKQTFINFSITLLSNLVGTAMIASMAVITQTFDHDHLKFVVYEITHSKVEYSWHVAFFKGIGCNMMICLAVFAVTASEDTAGKTLLSYSLLSSVAFMAFEHTIANGFTVPLGMMYGANVTLFEFIFYSFIPVTLGNLIGGMTIGVVIYSLYLRHEIIPLHIKTKLQPGIEGRAIPLARDMFEDVPILQRTSAYLQRLSKLSVEPNNNHDDEHGSNSEKLPLLHRNNNNDNIIDLAPKSAPIHPI